MNATHRGNVLLENKSSWTDSKSIHQVCMCLCLCLGFACVSFGFCIHKLVLNFHRNSNIHNILKISSVHCITAICINAVLHFLTEEFLKHINMSLKRSLWSVQQQRKETACSKHSVSCSNFQCANHINRENTGANFTLSSKVLLSATVPSCCP